MDVEITVFSANFTSEIGDDGNREEWFYSRPPGDAFSHSSFVLGFLAIGMKFLVNFIIKGSAPTDLPPGW